MKSSALVPYKPKTRTQSSRAVVPYDKNKFAVAKKKKTSTALAVPKKKKKKRKKRVKKATREKRSVAMKKQLDQPRHISDQLAVIIGRNVASRSEVLKGIWAYAKTRGLQQGREIHCDNHLRRIFQQSTVTMFNMQSLLVPHFDAAAPIQQPQPKVRPVHQQRADHAPARSSNNNVRGEVGQRSGGPAPGFVGKKSGSSNVNDLMDRLRARQAAGGAGASSSGGASSSNQPPQAKAKPKPRARPASPPSPIHHNDEESDGEWQEMRPEDIQRMANEQQYQNDFEDDDVELPLSSPEMPRPKARAKGKGKGQANNNAGKGKGRGKNKRERFCDPLPPDLDSGSDVPFPGDDESIPGDEVTEETLFGESEDEEMGSHDSFINDEDDEEESCEQDEPEEHMFDGDFDMDDEEENVFQGDDMNSQTQPTQPQHPSSSSKDPSRSTTKNPHAKPDIQSPKVNIKPEVVTLDSDSDTNIKQEPGIKKEPHIKQENHVKEENVKQENIKQEDEVSSTTASGVDLNYVKQEFKKVFTGSVFLKPDDTKPDPYASSWKKTMKEEGGGSDSDIEFVGEEFLPQE